jgi:hypothetical protein
MKNLHPYVFWEIMNQMFILIDGDYINIDNLKNRINKAI